MDLDPHGKETDAAPQDNVCVRNCGQEREKQGNYSR